MTTNHSKKHIFHYDPAHVHIITHITEVSQNTTLTMYDDSNTFYFLSSLCSPWNSFPSMPSSLITYRKLFLFLSSYHHTGAPGSQILPRMQSPAGRKGGIQKEGNSAGAGRVYFSSGPRKNSIPIFSQKQFYCWGAELYCWNKEH